MRGLVTVLRPWVAIALLTILVITLAFQFPYAYANNLTGCGNGDWSQGFVSGGWLENDDYCWLGPGASISFPYVAQNQPYQLTLRLAAGLRHGEGPGAGEDEFDPDIPARPLQVRVNDRLAQTLDVKGGWNPYRVRLESNVVAAGGDLNIEVREPDSFTGANQADAPSIAIARVRLLDTEQSGPVFILPPLLYAGAWALLVCWGWALLLRTPLVSYRALRIMILFAALAVLGWYWANDRLRLALSLPYVGALLGIAWFLASQIPLWRTHSGRARLEFLHSLGICDWRWRALIEWSIVAVLAGDMLVTHIWPLRTHSLFDFVAYYAGTQVWMNGGDYYNAAVIADHIKNNALLAGTNRFVYPPFAILLFVPLAVMSLPDAKTAWLILDCLWLIGTAILLYLTLRRYRAKLSPVWFMLLVITRPVGDGIGTGQVAILILFLFALGLYAWANYRPILAGSTIALAAGLKVFPVLLVPYLLFRRDWRTVGAAILTGMGFLVTGLFVGGVAQTRTFLTEILPAFSSGVEMTYNQSINGALRRLLAVQSGEWQGQPLPDPPVVRFATLVIAFTLVALTIWSFSRLDKSQRFHRALEFGAMIALILLVVPIVWENYLTWLILPVILVLHALANYRFSARAQLLVLSAIGTSWLFLQFGPIWYDDPGLPPPLRSLGLVAALLIYLCSLYVLDRVARSAPASGEKSRRLPVTEPSRSFEDIPARQ